MKTNSTASLPAGATAYVVNDKIDNTLHSLAFGVDYEMKKKITLKAGYVYDYYKDKVDSAFTGGHHLLMMGVKVGF
jgi:long-subunit fatty acid transport protein